MKTIRAWAILHESKILCVGQYGHLEVYPDRGRARFVIQYIKAIPTKKYEPKIVPVEIRIIA